MWERATPDGVGEMKKSGVGERRRKEEWHWVNGVGEEKNGDEPE